MTIPQELLDILVCPETKQKVHLASADTLKQINDRITKREIKTVGGSQVEQNIEGALVRGDGKIAYPIRTGIPVMLIEEGLKI